MLIFTEDFYMKKFLLCASALTLVLYAFSAKADGLTPYIEKNVSPVALNNILNAEKVFCYTVEMPSAGYTGYTLDQLALTGYCGQLGEERAVFVDEFFKKPNNISETVASCKIEPKIMLRFVRGIDATDVLFSDTCPSITVFYGGSMKSFNAAPAKQAIEAVVSVFGNGRTDFVSPALLNQLMPSGVPLSDEDKALVSKHKSAQPVRNWEKQNPPAAPKAEEPAAKGWNKLRK